MRSSLLFLALTGCVGVHLAHAPAVPYPMTEADLAEPSPIAPAGRLPSGFGIPSLRSVAPDPIAVEFTAARQILRSDVLEQQVPTTLNDAFHGAVGGNAGARIPVTVVIERLYTGCYPVRMGAVAAGEYAFVEALVSFHASGQRRIRFTITEESCGNSADEMLARIGKGLAAETVALAGEVQ
ncbi:MAG: hypothetical protein KC912_01775 [Proteobacteria bacterium]|nr:hypothetical protein [Pseudomonadota bacterium]